MCEFSSGWTCPALAVSVLSNLLCSDACSLLGKTQSSKGLRKLGEVFMFFTTIKNQIRDESLNKSVLFVCLCVELYTHLFNEPSAPQVTAVTVHYMEGTALIGSCTHNCVPSCLNFRACCPDGPCWAPN